jgi:hypothetical protein
MGLFVLWFPAMAGVFDHFARQGALDENGLAVNVRNAASFMIQGFDMCERHGVRRGRFNKRRRL